jgi:2-methylisocitrate lyase-like PEP mutase family enzyme
MTDQAAKARRFAELHARNQCFVIPNPWDVGSGRLLEKMGFEALATSSAGYAFSIGKPDMGITREMKMRHLRELCAVTTVPVSADLQNGFGDRPEDAAETIRQAAAAGVAGGSIEDSGMGNGQIYDIELAAERMRAAAEAAAALPFKFTLTGRAENFLYGRTDLDDTIRRLQAYQEAGADVLFAPGLRNLDEIRSVLAAIDRPLNVILGAKMGLTVAQLQELGVRRISIGGALARAAYGAMERAAQEMLGGSFGYIDGIPTTRHFNELFAD